MKDKPVKVYQKLRSLLRWTFRNVERTTAEAIVRTVIYAALDWDIPPSDIDNMMNDYVDLPAVIAAIVHKKRSNKK